MSCIRRGLGFAFGVLISFTCISTYAGNGSNSKDIAYMPRAYVNGNAKYVPLDILTNDVRWGVSQDLRQITATAKVTFQVSEAGYPFLLLNPNSEAYIAGVKVDLEKMTTPEFSESQYHAIMTEVVPGKSYEIGFKYSFEFDPSKAKHILPLEYYSHKFAEMGMPANAPYDHYALSLAISVEGAGDFDVFANGSVKKIDGTTFKVIYPEHFTSMSFFIDVTPSSKVFKREFTVKSVDGRSLRAVVYSDDESVKKWVPTFAGIVEYTFYEMEKMFGEYPQDTLILKISDREIGGGAYAGALVLSSDYMEHISHELGHSWFLQSVAPASGEDSWIYEGFGNWAPLFGYRSGFVKDLNLENSVVLNKGPYKIWATQEMFPLTNLRMPHQTGSMILASIDQYIKSSGKAGLKEGLVPVLKLIAKEKRHQTMSTRDFEALLGKHTGLSFKNLFDYYIVK